MGASVVNARLRRLTHVLFALVLVLALGTRSHFGRVGLLAWLPLFHLDVGSDIAIGALALAPLLWMASWTVLLLRSRRGWQWGDKWLTGSLAVFSLLAALGFTVAPSAGGVTALASLALAWLVYLFLVNENPSLLPPLLLVLLLQGGVALAQFGRQRDLGLRLLGEMSLDPAERGIFVLVAGGERVLRGYGLTNYPNLLGALLVVTLLLALPRLRRLQGWRLALASLACTVGALGLVASFSRSAWLALAVGIVLSWGAALWSGEWKRLGRAQVLATTLPLLAAGLFLLANRGLALSRVIGIAETPTEAMSIAVRTNDLDIARQIVVAHPWRGVGLGNYRAAARQIMPRAFIVHNVPLLVTAELGVFGGLAWLALMLAGLWCGRRSGYRLGLWLGVLLVGLFDTTLWLTVSWRAAVLLALILAEIGRE